MLVNPAPEVQPHAVEEDIINLEQEPSSDGRGVPGGGLRARQPAAALPSQSTIFNLL